MNPYIKKKSYRKHIYSKATQNTKDRKKGVKKEVKKRGQRRLIMIQYGLQVRGRKQANGRYSKKLDNISRHFFRLYRSGLIKIVNIRTFSHVHVHHRESDNNVYTQFAIDTVLTNKAGLQLLPPIILNDYETCYHPPGYGRGLAFAEGDSLGPARKMSSDEYNFLLSCIEEATKKPIDELSNGAHDFISDDHAWTYEEACQWGYKGKK